MTEDKLCRWNAPATQKERSSEDTLVGAQFLKVITDQPRPPPEKEQVLEKEDPPIL
jgi:hypothetical protein